jgi:hypothetical protein
MPHFSDEVFADFVRGIEVPGHKELLSHLASQCADCRQIYGIWHQLQLIAAREHAYCPSPAVVRMIQVEFEARKTPQHELQGSLVFDSLSQPVLAGVRSAGQAAARQMVYEAEGMMVDLRFDRPAHSKCVSLIGQVLDQKAPRVSLANASVMLWTEKGLVLVETKTNALGEFHMEFEAQNRLRLSIQASRGPLIRIHLANLVVDQSSNSVTGGTSNGYC